MPTARLWPSTNGSGSYLTDGLRFTFGAEFEVQPAGVASAEATAIHKWIGGPDDVGDVHTGVIYRVDTATTGTQIGAAGTATPAATGWLTIPLTPVSLVLGQRYRAAVWAGTVGVAYTSLANYWSTGGGAAGISSGPLFAPPASGAIGGLQGTFRATNPTILFPQTAFSSSNYWVDVTVDYTLSGSQSYGQIDPLGVSEVVGRVLTGARTTGDPLGVASTTLAGWSRTVTLVEALTAGDGLDQLAARTVTLTDPLAGADTLTSGVPATPGRGWTRPARGISRTRGWTP